jgi:hypothetical protein
MLSSKFKRLGTAAVVTAALFLAIPASASDSKQDRAPVKAPMSLIVAQTAQELVCTNKCNANRGGCGTNSPAQRKCYNACMGRKVCPEN